MNLSEYKTELRECLSFGLWCEGFNPGKAEMLVRMAERDLDDASLAELYCYWTYCCFDSSANWGEETEEYYETAVKMFDRMIELVERQETNELFKELEPLKEEVIDAATRAEKYVGNYEDYFSWKWDTVKWADGEWEEDDDDGDDEE